MGYGIHLEVWGDYALFTRPEMKIERVSYDVITPSAARGLIEAIYWKPAIRWIIDKIYVYNPIVFSNIRRNEVDSKIDCNILLTAANGSGEQSYIDASKAIQQRASIVLQDVRYIIAAHFEMTDSAGESDNPKKHYNIALRRMRQGQCFHTPCFGCREFPAFFRLVEGEIPPPPSVDLELGYMLYDLDFRDPQNIEPVFFRAAMKNGIIDLTDCEVAR